MPELKLADREEIRKEIEAAWTRQRTASTPARALPRQPDSPTRSTLRAPCAAPSGSLCGPFFCMIDSRTNRDTIMATTNLAATSPVTAKNIWLAGLGAYGKANSDAKGKLDEAAEEPPRLFRELVEKGMRLEDEVRDSLSSIRKSHPARGRSASTGCVKPSRVSTGATKWKRSTRKVDALTEKVDALAAGRKAGKSGRPKKACPKAAEERRHERAACGPQKRCSQKRKPRRRSGRQPEKPPPARRAGTDASP